MSWWRRWFGRADSTVTLPGSLPKPLPDDWVEILNRNASFRARLSPARREKLDRNLPAFIRSRNWEGCGGLALTDEQRVTIAAHALRLSLGVEADLLSHVETILVYPTPYEAPSRESIGSAVVLEGVSQRLGESWYRGPVILAWSDLMANVVSTSPHNLVLHEFAHQIDYRNGREADGIPPMGSDEQAAQWSEVTRRAHARLCRLYEANITAVLDEYATSNMAEFFAVTTEAFFETPVMLAKDWPDLYRVFRRFYQQDPRTDAVL